MNSPTFGTGHALDPLLCADLVLSAKTLEQTHAALYAQIGTLIHVNSLIITVGIQLPANPHCNSATPVTSFDSAGVLVNEEWTAFLVDGNVLADPMVKRLQKPHHPQFWWENSPLHQSMNDDDRVFAQHYFDHDIRLGVVEGRFDHRQRTADIIAFDSRCSQKEYREFERVYGGQLQLAMAWVWEALHIRQMSNSALLSAREQECLKWTSTGLTSSEISARLHISTTTVNEYIAGAMRRLDAQTRVQACARATLLGLIAP